MNQMSSKIGFFIAISVGLMVFANGTPARADELTGAQHLVSITKGGLLYDKWYGQLEVDAPEKTHPLYPAAGKQKGASTWRCKECHGWDYKGVHGAYSKGSHFTGITGLRNMTHTPVDKIVEILSDKKHGYDGLIPKDSMLALAHFVAHGQVDMDEYIDRNTKKARGNVERGERIFQTTCVRCHGVDGKEINFKTPPAAEFIGTVASGNPWETLHKIRSGQPSVQMISMLAFDVQTHVDILAYAQTLPTK
jgi:thiosulfate dehydrogenase